MDIINANLTRMPQVEILGIPALLTPHEVSRATVHLGLYCYELQGNTEKPGEAMILVEQSADSFFYGIILTLAPLLMQGAQQLELDSRDVLGKHRAAYFTPAEFEARYFG